MLVYEFDDIIDVQGQVLALNGTFALIKHLAGLIKVKSELIFPVRVDNYKPSTKGFQIATKTQLLEMFVPVFEQQ